MAKRSSELIQGDIAKINQQIQELTQAAKSVPRNPNNPYAHLNNPYTQQIQALQKQVQALNMESQGLNPDGSPMRPDREGLLDDQGNLDEKYLLDLEQLDPNSLEGYNMVKALATQEGPSKYAQDATKLAELGKQDAIDSGVRQAASSAAAARASLGMRGGVSSGARERMAYNMQNNLLDTRQDAYRQNTQDQLKIGLQDEQMKRDMLTNFANAEGNIAKSNLGLRNQSMEYNLANLLKEKDAANLWNMDVYKEQNAKWAAGKQADATAKSGGGGGGGGCFITTAVCEHLGLPDDNPFLNTFRKFRDEVLGADSDLVKEYYAEAPGIVEFINRQERKDAILGYVLYHYMTPAYFAILKGDNEKAQDIYCEMFTTLKNMAGV